MWSLMKQNQLTKETHGLQRITATLPLWAAPTVRLFFYYQGGGGGHEKVYWVWRGDVGLCRRGGIGVGQCVPEMQGRCGQRAVSAD
jgi:hypothetical protein